MEKISQNYLNHRNKDRIEQNFVRKKILAMLMQYSNEKLMVMNMLMLMLISDIILICFVGTRLRGILCHQCHYFANKIMNNSILRVVSFCCRIFLVDQNLMNKSKLIFLNVKFFCLDKFMFLFWKIWSKN